MTNGIDRISPYTQVPAQPQSEPPRDVQNQQPTPEYQVENSGVSGVAPQPPENNRLIDTYG